MIVEKEEPFCYTIHCYTRDDMLGIVKIHVQELLYFSSDPKQLLLDCYKLATEYFKEHFEELFGYSIIIRNENYRGYPGAEIVKEGEEGYKVAWIVVAEIPNIKE